MTHELSSAKYYQQAQANDDEAPIAETPRAARGGGLERFHGYVTAAVAAVVLTVGAAALWLSRSSINDGASYVGKRTNNPVNLMMWLAGSDKTIEDAVGAIQAQSAAELESQISAGSFLDGSEIDMSHFQTGVAP